MNKEQPEALRLADALQAEFPGYEVADVSAAELRRLAAVEIECAQWKDDAINGGNAQYLRDKLATVEAERDALKAELDRIRAMEPVAWRTFDGEGGYDYRTYDMNEDYAEDYAKRNPKYAHWVEPLYTLEKKP